TSRRRHTRCYRDWSSDVCSSDLPAVSEHATEDVAGDPVRRILSPEVITCERPAGVQRTVGSQNDFHRVTTRLSSVPESCPRAGTDRKSTRLNSSHGSISYAVFCL